MRYSILALPLATILLSVPPSAMRAVSGPTLHQAATLESDPSSTATLVTYRGSRRPQSTRPRRARSGGGSSIGGSAAAAAAAFAIIGVITAKKKTPKAAAAPPGGGDVKRRRSTKSSSSKQKIESCTQCGGRLFTQLGQPKEGGEVGELDLYTRESHGVHQIIPGQGGQLIIKVIASLVAFGACEQEANRCKGSAGSDLANVAKSLLKTGPGIDMETQEPEKVLDSLKKGDWDNKAQGLYGGLQTARDQDWGRQVEENLAEKQPKAAGQ